MKLVVAASLALLTLPCLAHPQATSEPVSPVKVQEEPDYGPQILGNFLKVIPGLLTMASGQKSDNPELAAAGFEQFAKGFSGFLGALEKVIQRKPGALNKLREPIILQEDFFTEALEEELASPEGQQALRSWKRSMEQQENVIFVEEDCNDDEDDGDHIDNE